MDKTAAAAAADDDDAGDWVSHGDDEFSGLSADTSDDASVVTVAFHCYHSLPDHAQVH